MRKQIAVLSGDGIGPEVMREAIRVVDAVACVGNHKFDYQEALVGGAAWDRYGQHLPDETMAKCDDCDAVLFGSVGGPVSEQHLDKWKSCETQSILALRKHLSLNINLRPVKIYSALKANCVLNPDRISQGVDILCVRELSEGIYFGKHCTEGLHGDRTAMDVMTYHESTIEAIAHVAFQAAMSRNKKLTSVDKANVLDCSKLWREVVTRVGKQYPECELEHQLVDNCAMQLLISPSSFDVLLAPNMFGDILSDEISIFSGSLGMLPSASLNSEGFGLYEPSGGSAPDLAGKNCANPIGQILSAAMMLKYSFALHEEHDAIVKAVENLLDQGFRTGDIGNENVLTTEEMGKAIADAITSSYMTNSNKRDRPNEADGSREVSALSAG